ncbi:hypothetical protein [Nocardia alni]|uniref:hypothetical protein n=1 Tax=Nocardia alni TaxID=2815723 RepID=UPI001C229B0B|nr:hypothetical protein [Nocardia alni]
MGLLSHARTRAALALAAGIAVAGALAGCGTHSAHPSVGADLTRVPAGLHWDTFAGIAIPAGDDGPASTGVTDTGYAQTPQGAALAALDHTVRISTADNSSWGPIAAAEVASSPGADAWKLARARLRISGPANPALAPRIIGYRITSYQPDKASVTAYSVYPDKSLAATAIGVIWSGGDWRLSLPDPASTTPTVTAIRGVPTTGLVRLEGAR